MDLAAPPPAAPPSPAPPSVADGRTVALSPSAARRVRRLGELEGRPGLMLRLTVTGGGCAGFSYNYSLVDAAEPDDLVFERDGARLLVDEVSLDLVAGSEIEFVDDLMGAYFQVKNPNAASGCGCGTSFSLKA